MEGRIDHGDSLGNEGSILGGGCQWMTAGSGIIHQEMPKPAPRMLGLQLWINLPAKRKMADPRYRDIREGMVPVVESGGARVSVIAGDYDNTAGAARGDHVDATVLDIRLEAGRSCIVPTKPGDTVFVYIVQGALSFEASGDADFRDARQAVLFGDGDKLSIQAAPMGVSRCVLFAGKPLDEPIAWGGPIVMNTADELDLAFRELDEGTFIKHAPAPPRQNG
jgi:redox-sensitive bicupin YhaK (pirin superfamily)